MEASDGVFLVAGYIKNNELISVISETSSSRSITIEDADYVFLKWGASTYHSHYLTVTDN